MTVRKHHQPTEIIRRLFTVRNGSLLFAAFCVGGTLISVGITSGIASILGTDTADKLGTLGQIVEPVSAAFSGLAFIALVVTFRLQYDELVLQRQELESQRHAMNRTHSELHRSADADIRACHVELMRLSMEDYDLAEVWPEFRSGLSPKQTKQYSYANLIVQHQRMAWDLGELDNAQVLATFQYLFASRIMRDFWEARMLARHVFAKPGTTEGTFDQIVDDAFNETPTPVPPLASSESGGDIVDLDSHRHPESDAA
jgi:hypothetical protein